MGVAVVAYSGWWYLTARSLTSRINLWIAGEQAKGAKITPPMISVGGYPLAFAIKLTNVNLAWPSGFGFSSQSLKLRTRPWSFTSFKVNAAGGFAIMLPAGTNRPALTLAGETLRGHTRFYDSALPLDIDISADTVSATQTATADTPAAREMTVATVEFNGSRPKTQPAADTDVAYDLSLKLIDLSAQLLEKNPLGGTIGQTFIHAQLLGKPPTEWDAAGIKIWRDAGGTVNLPELSLRWGELNVTGNGTLAMDKDMQPEGALATHVSGFEQALDSLAAAGWIKLSSASLAKMAMGIAAHPGPDGKPVCDAPLTIQNRHIQLGPAKLGQMPELKLD